MYLATLLMQGIETASLANDACGVPLPWMMTNPWLFFDGKLFHLKLKMSTYVTTLRELCDNQIDIVLKVERFRKAILEDVEHYLLPGHMGKNDKNTEILIDLQIIRFYIFHFNLDPLYRAGFIQSSSLQQAYGKNAIHPIANIPHLSNGSSAYYNSVVQQHQAQQSQQTQGYYANAASARNNGNYRNKNYGNKQPQQTQQQLNQPHSFLALNRQGGYQLKVGGVVVGSWAGSAPNRSPSNVQARLNRAAIAAAAAAGGAVSSHLVRYPLNTRNRVAVSTRLQRTLTSHQHVATLGRTISRNTYANNKVNRNRNRNRNRNKERKGQKQSSTDKSDVGETKDNNDNDESTNDEINAQDSENANG